MPIQRILLPADRLAAEMERVRRNVLAQMPRDEFEALVRRAAEATEAAKNNPPRLVEARYRASLSGNGLVGSAEWKIVHSAAGPGRLPLNSLQLALRSARWPDNRPALLGVLDDRPGAPLELLVEKSGESTLSLEWSARGLPEPTGLRFDLRLPPCPIATLELELSDEVTPQADRDGCLVSGPSLAKTSGQRLWRVSFPGRSGGLADPVPLLLLRPPQPGQPGPLIRSVIQTSLKLTPGQAECDFDVDLTVSRGSVRELTLECDPGLRPYDVVVPGLEGWETKAGPGSATLIQVRLRDPFRGGRATVRALAALPGPETAWTCPGLRVRDGMPGGETLTLRVHPDLQLDDWKASGFRWVDSQTAADQFHVLTLRAGLGNSGRPKARVRPAGAVFDVRQTADWQVDPGHGALTEELRFLVRRGVLFHIPLTIPPGWEVEQVEAVPPDPALRWVAKPATATAAGLLTIEPSRPLTVLVGVKDDDPSHFQVVARFRSAGPVGQDPRIALPDVTTSGARQREGTLAVHVGPSATASVETALPQIRPDVYSFRGPAADGWLQLRRRFGGLQVRCDSESQPQGGLLHNTFHLELRPDGEAGSELLLATSAPVSGSWTCKTLQGVAEVHAVSPLPAMSLPPYLAGLAGNPAAAAAIAAANPGGRTWWRLSFDQALQQPVTLELSCDSPIGPDAWNVPLLEVPGAAAVDGSAAVLAPPDWDATHAGVRDELPEPRQRTDRRLFRYGRGPVRLRLARSGRESTPLGGGTLTLLPTTGGQLLAHWSVRVVGWREAELPVMLPAGAEPVRVEVDGRLVPLSSNGDGTLILPRTSAPAQEVAIVYAMPMPPCYFAAAVSARAPNLPFPVPLRYIWRLPTGLGPAAPERWRLLNEPATVRRGEFSAGETRDWEAPPGDDGQHMTLVKSAALKTTSVALAGLLAILTLAGWAAKWRRLQTLLLLALVVAGLASLWLPGGVREIARWPLIVAVAGVFIVLLAAIVGRRPVPISEGSTVIRKPVAVVAVILLFALASSAAGPSPTPVYLVPGNPEPQLVLAPPVLIERLERLARSAAPTSGAVLLGARYDGRVEGQVAQFEVSFSVHCFNDSATTLTVPLGGVQLRDAFLDGMPAFPRAAGPERYAVDVKGRGAHSLALHFDVRVATGVEREVRFSVPELPVSSLSLLGPHGAQGLQILAWRGSQRTTMEADRPRLDLDLGRVAAVQLRWRQLGDAAARPRVQEFGLWDVNDAAARLQAVYRYQFGTAHASRLEYDVPAQLEVESVAVKALDDRAAAVGVVGVRDVRRDPATHRLRVDFQTPLTGTVQVKVDLIPRQPLDARPGLSMPGAVGAAERETLMAVRVRGWEPTVAESAGLALMSAETFRDQWLALRVESDARSPLAAFRGVPGQTAVLRLALHAPASPARARQQVTWLLGPGRAEVRAVATWEGGPPPGPVDWILPANIVLAEVRGRELRSWSRSGNTLQVWLDRPADGGGTSLELIGWLARPTDDAAQEKTPFVLPQIQVSDPASEPPRVQVQARGRWRIVPREVAGYRPLPDTDLPGFQWSAVAPETGGRAEFQVQPAKGSAAGTIVSVADITGNQFHFTSTLALRSPAGLNTLRIQLRRAAGMAAALTVPAGVRLRETHAGPEGTTWVIDCEPGSHNLVIAGQWAATGVREFPFPDVEIGGTGPIQLRRWAIAGSGWRPRDAAGVRPVAPPFAELPAGIVDNPKSGAVWHLESADWRLLLEPAAAPASVPAVAPCEVRIAPGGDGRWLLDVRYLGLREPDADWAVSNGGNELLALIVTGRELAPGVRGGRVSVPATEGLCTVRLVCRTPQSVAAGLDGVQLPRLVVGGVALPAGPTFWAVRAPAESRPRLEVGPSWSAAEFDARVTTASAIFARAAGRAVAPTRPAAFADVFECGAAIYTQTAGDPPALRLDGPETADPVKWALSGVLGLVLLGGLLWGSRPAS
ncbi:MAG: hypothetical protein ACJ8F7_08605 [Gemmataceae bacterium]